MMELENKLDLIKNRIEELISQGEKLVSDNSSLLAENQDLKSQIEENKKLISELENKALNLQFNNSIENEEKNKLKTVIEDLIIEIDKGIELLKS